MKHIFTAALVLFAASAFAATSTKTTATTTAAATTAGPTGGTIANEGFHIIHVADLKAMEKTTGPVFIFDANNDKTRKTEGMITGAKPLTSVTDYDVAQTLPADKKAPVVFYCANTMCMASHEAAKRAVAAGYENVSVMADGIQGWKKSGQSTVVYK